MPFIHLNLYECPNDKSQAVRDDGSIPKCRKCGAVMKHVKNYDDVFTLDTDAG